MRIVVAGWIGSANVGDEFVFAGVCRAITAAFGDTEIVALSLKPEATRDTHAVDAVHAHDPVAVTRAIKGANLMVFGGGGLIQHETSPFNLPYHLSRVAIALAAKTPVVGVGLGVSPISSAIAKRLVPVLRQFRGLTVRDTRSQATLDQLHVDAQVACDMAWHTAAATPPPPVVRAEPHVLLALRPWGATRGGQRSRLPVALARNRNAVPYAARLTHTVNRLRDQGFTVTGLAMQPGRDDSVYARVDTPIDVITPTVDSLVDDVSGHDVVVAMRYHAGVGAALAQTRSVLIGYSDKVTSLADTLGRGARHLPFAPHSFSTFDQHVTDVLADPNATHDLAAARETQLKLRDVNVHALRDALN